MKTYYILFNKLAKSNNGEAEAHCLDNILTGHNLVYIDMATISDYKEFLSSVTDNDCIVIAGGDGTLNYFINHCDLEDIKCPLMYFPAGSGNDFARDTGHKTHCPPFEITEHMKDMPVCVMKGKKMKFFNNAAFGVDGYCCVEGDRQRQNSTKKVNYSLIALKGILLEYQNTDAVVNVDGKEYIFKDVLLAPAMKGRYFGGGIKIAPGQNRYSHDKNLTLVVVHGVSKLKALMLFASIYSGNHTKFTKYVTTLTGKSITVRYNRPAPAQVDGETIGSVIEYSAYADEKTFAENNKIKMTV